MSTITILNEDQIKVIVGEAVRAVLRSELDLKKEPKQNGYITRKQASALLHVSLPTLHAWINQGKIKSYRIGGRTLFKENEVLEAVKPLDYNLERKGGNKLW